MGEHELEGIRQGYEPVAAEYARRCFGEWLTLSYERDILNLFLAHVQGPVCDLGCGPGHVLHYLEAQGYPELLGLDLSPAMLEEARRRNPGLQFLEANFCQLPVAAEAWGGIVAFYSLIHLPRAAVLPVLQELWRVLRPEGLLLVAFHVGEGTYHAQTWQGQISSVLHYTRFTLAEMQGYLGLADFSLEGAVEMPASDPSTTCARGYIFARKTGQNATSL